MKPKLTVLFVFGTRPEAVKLAPVIKEMGKHPHDFDVRVCVTAQHREMLDQVLNAFKITPDIDLNLMQHDQSLAELTARIFDNLDEVIKDIMPDWLIIQGDTTTVMAAAILGYYNHVKIGHVEAGLRTHNKWQPFPEEINRRLASVVADLHFAPTENNRQNLLQEGVPDKTIRVTGNPAIDALRIIAEHPAPQEAAKLLKTAGVSEGKRRLLLVTAHRRENFGQPIRDICFGLKKIAQHYPNDLTIIYPVHLNPNIQRPVHEILAGIENIMLLEPLDYLPMVHLMKNSTLILTDSGGIQEEAPSFGVPTLVLRERTERQEGITAGTLKLVGTNSEKLFQEAINLLDNPEAYNAMAGSVNPYGDGFAAKRIVNVLLETWSEK